TTCCDYRSGRIVAKRNVRIRPMMELMVRRTVQLRRVSRSVRPPSLLTTQKPLSFIQEQQNAPKPTARKRYIEWKGRGGFVAGSINGQRIEEGVNKATR